MLDNITWEKLQARLAHDREMMNLFKEYIRDLKQLGEKKVWTYVRDTVHADRAAYHEEHVSKVNAFEKAEQDYLNSEEAKVYPPAPVREEMKHRSVLEQYKAHQDRLSRIYNHKEKTLM